MGRIFVSVLIASWLYVVAAYSADKDPALATPLPDAGGTELVPTDANGVGPTPEEAVTQAIKNAILQVNGAWMNSRQAQVNLSVHVSDGKDAATLTGRGFAERIISESKGAITDLTVRQVTPKDDGYVASITATVAKFKPPAAVNRIKIVIANVQSASPEFDIGGVAVSAASVATAIRQQLIDALSQTGRFTVLDRDYGASIQGELNLIASGEARNIDYAKLAQALSADLVWVGTINSFAYKKTARQLQTSDRQLVTYSGGWSLSHRLINVATRHIVASQTLEGSAPEMGPTTLRTDFDRDKTVNAMQSASVSNALDAILVRTFPISVVSRTGNSVVLSQGGKALVEQGQYKVVLLGDELRDPQTGQSLGRAESPCCLVAIDKVTPNVTYGTLQNIGINLEKAPLGLLQVREQLMPYQRASPASASSNDAPSLSTLPSSGKDPVKPMGEPAKAKDDRW